MFKQVLDCLFLNRLKKLVVNMYPRNPKCWNCRERWCRSYCVYQDKHYRDKYKIL
jgi:hypothetical protein